MSDKNGTLYGKFMCEWFAWCPNWKPGSGNWNERFSNQKYDFGVVQLAPRVGDEADAGKIVQQFEVEWGGARLWWKESS